MSSIGTFIISFCTSCIVLGLLFLLVPKSALSKPVKYIFALCFVCCIVSSVIAIKKPDFSDFETAKAQEIITPYNASVTAQAVFSEALNSSNINFTKITVDTNKLSDGSIIISKVTVYTNEQPQRVKEIIGNNSYEVVIINE